MINAGKNIIDIKIIDSFTLSFPWVSFPSKNNFIKCLKDIANMVKKKTTFMFIITRKTYGLKNSSALEISLYI
jgi:hypothetical protein